MTVRCRNAGRVKLFHLALRFTRSGEMPLGAFPCTLHFPTMLRKIGASTAAGASFPESAKPRYAIVASFVAQCHRADSARGVRRYAQMPDQTETPGLRPRPLKRPPPAQVKDIPVSTHSSVLNKYLAPGKLLEFRNLDSFVLALIVSQVRKEDQPSSHLLYEVIDAEGHTHNVKPSQIVVVLPGKGYTIESVKEISSKVRMFPTLSCPAPLVS